MNEYRAMSFLILVMTIRAGQEAEGKPCCFCKLDDGICKNDSKRCNFSSLCLAKDRLPDDEIDRRLSSPMFKI